MRRHRWSPPVRRAFGDRSNYTERECYLCGALKLTIHPPEGLPWTEWKVPGRLSMVLDRTPPCPWDGERPK